MTNFYGQYIGFGSGTAAASGGGYYGTRGLTAGGYAYPSPSSNKINYITIASAGDAEEFGTLLQAKRTTDGLSNGSGGRGLNASGSNTTPAHFIEIEYVTIATTMTALSFGDLTMPRNGTQAMMDGTYGLFCGGYSGLSPDERVEMDKVNVASTGDATAWGEMTTPGSFGDCVMNGTIGLIAGIGNVPGGYAQNLIQTNTIATDANAADWNSNLYHAGYQLGATSSDETLGRGIWHGRADDSSNVMQYVTIASSADSQDFGNLVNGSKGGWGNQNGVRGVMMRGAWLPSNEMNWVTMASIGDADDFGNLTFGTNNAGGMSGD